MKRTGPDQATRDLVRGRDRHCVMCPDGYDCHLHHRSARRMGGSRLPEKNSPANLIVLCPDHHSWVEGHPDESRHAGLIVASHADPETTPVVWHGDWVYLTADGQVEPVVDGAS